MAKFHDAVMYYCIWRSASENYLIIIDLPIRYREMFGPLSYGDIFRRISGTGQEIVVKYGRRSLAVEV